MDPGVQEGRIAFQKRGQSPYSACSPHPRRAPARGPSPFLGRSCLVLLALAGLVRPAAAQNDWPKLLFKSTRHDFGVVAAGAVAEFRFQMENPYVEDVHISKVESSCGCTKPRVTQPLLKTYQTGEIVAALDTRRFKGQKDAKITVYFDKPFDAKYDLNITSYIRQDVVFEPGVVQFGTVSQGQSSRKRVSIAYAGRSTWKILDVGAGSPYLGLEIAEVGRTLDPKTKAAQVTYDLWVTLKDTAPPGYFKDQVIVRTDDLNQQTARMPLTVEGLVIPSLTVNPAVLMLGVVQPGQTVSRNLVVRGQKPFQVLDVSGPGPQFRFTLPQAAREVQLIGVQFQAGDTPGRVSGKIRIKTDAAGTDALEASVDGLVVAPGATK